MFPTVCIYDYIVLKCPDSVIVKQKVFPISQSKQVDINLIIHIMLTGQKTECKTHLVK